MKYFLLLYFLSNFFFPQDFFLFTDNQNANVSLDLSSTFLSEDILHVGDGLKNEIQTAPQFSGKELPARHLKNCSMRIPKKYSLLFREGEKYPSKAAAADGIYIRLHHLII